MIDTLAVRRLAYLVLALAGLCLGSGCVGRKAAPPNYVFFPPAPDEPRIQYLMSYGSESDLGGAGKFRSFIVGEEKIYKPITKPYGVAIRDGKVYVVDTQARNVSVADLATRRLRYIKPEGQAAMQEPNQVAVGPDGTIYVTDLKRCQVLLYSPEGNLLNVIGSGREMRPCGIALAGNRLYVTDITNHCVRVYNPATREQLLQFPRESSKDRPDWLFTPTNIAVDREGRIYVTDTGDFCLKIFDAEGKYLRRIGEQGQTPGYFSRPKGVAVDREGRTYVLDADFSAAQVFDREGRLLLAFGMPDKSGSGSMYLPAGMTIDYDNLGLFRKYVAPGQQIDYVLLVINQAGPHKVSAYAFLKKK